MTKIRLRDIFISSMQIGFSAFGGGASMISFVRKMYVDDKQWIESDVFDQIAIIANILPGPVILQLLALIHYKTRGFKGVIVALIPFVFIIPSVFVIAVSVFEQLIPEALLHKITLALVPFILLLTSEYIYVLFNAQINRNKTPRDWIATAIFTIFAIVLLLIGMTTTIVIFSYLSAVIAYAMYLHYRGTVRE